MMGLILLTFVHSEGDFAMCLTLRARLGARDETGVLRPRIVTDWPGECTR